MAGYGDPGVSSVDAHGLRLGIVAARWHADLVDHMVERAQAAAKACGVDEVTTVRVAGSVELPAPGTRVARLTVLQWENAVQDLLRLDAPTGFSSELPQDAYPADFLFDNPADTLGVDPTQWQGFQRAAARPDPASAGRSHT